MPWTRDGTGQGGYTVTVNEAAKEIGLSAKAVYALCMSGLLPHRRIGPNQGRIVILPAHVAKYLASCEVNEDNAPGAVGTESVKTSRRMVYRDRRPDGLPFRHE